MGRGRVQPRWQPGPSRIAGAMAYKEAWNEGYADGKQQAIIASYLAVSIALHEKFGFGAIRAERVLKTAEKLMMDTIDVNELYKKAQKAVGIRFRFFDEEGTGLSDMDLGDFEFE